MPSGPLRIFAVALQIWTSTMARAGDGTKLEIIATRPRGVLTLCRLPWLTVGTRDLRPFKGPLEVGSGGAGRYVCIEDGGEVEKFVRLIVVEKELRLEIDRTELIHLQPVDMSCSVTVWQSQDTLENIISIGHGVTEVARKEFYRHEDKLEIRLDVSYRPSFHDGRRFSCTWTAVESWGSTTERKDLETIVRHRDILVPVTKVRPSSLAVGVGQPVHCLYEGSRTDRVAWSAVGGEPEPRVIAAGDSREVIRFMEIGRYEFACEVNLTDELGSRWSGTLDVKAQDFNDSSLPLTYSFVGRGSRVLLDSVNCRSDSKVYWINQSQVVPGQLRSADSSHAGLYGCLIGSDVVALLRLVVLRRNLTFLRTPSGDLNCTLEAWMGVGRLAENRLELSLPDGSILATSDRSTEVASQPTTLNVAVRWVKVGPEHHGKVARCRWIVSEVMAGLSVYRKVVESQDGYEILAPTTSPPVLRGSEELSVGPNATTTRVGRLVVCSDRKSPERACAWRHVGGPSAREPRWIELGRSLMVLTEGAFVFECRCFDRETGGSVGPSWRGEIRVLPGDDLPLQTRESPVQVKFASSKALKLKAKNWLLEALLSISFFGTKFSSPAKI